MKKLVAEQNLKKERLSGLFLMALVVVVAALSVTRVLIANRLVESSERLRNLDQSISQVQRANQDLAENLRGPQSLSQIETEAGSLGFSKTTRLVILPGADSVALLR